MAARATWRKYQTIADRYAEDVCAGRIAACASTIAACRRHLDDLAQWRRSGPWTWEPQRGARVCQFVELMPHVKGPLAGRRIELDPWQVWLLMSVFSWVDGDGARRFRRAYIEVPRGNAKSTLSAAVGLYMLLADGEAGAEVYSFATTREQARIVFATAQMMARKSPDMLQHFGAGVAAHAIHTIDGTFQAKSSEADTLDGLNTHFACIDELHAHRTRHVYDVVETSIGKRRQPLLWVITTAGSDTSGVCYELHRYVERILEKSAQDQSQFGVIYSIDAGDDWTTEDALIKANPGWGKSVQPDTVRALQRKAVSVPSAAAAFQTKHLNVWVNANDAWMDMTQWRACAEPIGEDDFAGEPCWIGLDLASRTDFCAVAILHRREVDGASHYWLRHKYYLPRETVERGENDQYRGWTMDGHIRVTEGPTTDFSAILEDLLDLASVYDVQQIYYDPFQAAMLTKKLSDYGLPVAEMRPTVLNFSEPMKLLEALVLEKRLHHDGSPVTEWMAGNVVCHRDAKDNIYPRRESRADKIDGIVAAIMALAGAMREEVAPAEVGVLLL